MSPEAESCIITERSPACALLQEVSLIREESHIRGVVVSAASRASERLKARVTPETGGVMVQWLVQRAE